MSGGAVFSAAWLAELTGIALPGQPEPPAAAEAGDGPATASGPAAEDVADRLRRRMALRGRLPPSGLLPAGLPPRTREAALAQLVRDCDPGIGAEGWLLQDGPRRKLLALLGPARLAALLDEDQAPEDPVWHSLDTLARGALPALETMPRPALEALLDAIMWTGMPGPGSDKVRWHLARRRRRDTFNMPFGCFIGRRTERARLREFLAAPSPAPHPDCTISSLMLWGAGGRGKSALLATVLGELLDADPDTTLVHLDLDRPGLDPLAPATLDLEVLRQVALSDETQDARLRALRRDLRLSMEAPHAASVAAEAAEATASAAMSDSLSCLRDHGRPLILVLDTLERVQDRGAGARRRLLDWLGKLAATSGVGHLRILACGRDAPDVWLTPGAAGSLALDIAEASEAGDATELLPLEDLTPEDAEVLLRCCGVTEDVPRLVAVFGGNPLILCVVAELALRGDRLAFGESDLPRPVVHAYLFERTLRHIADREARRYAHPAIFLPAITPEVIGGVLAPVLGLEALDMPQATTIFEALSAVSWLVRRERRTLYLRDDVRTLLVRLAAGDEEQRALAARVHRQAAQWHRGQPGGEHAALAIYHAAVLDPKDVPKALPEGARGHVGRLVAELEDPARTTIEMLLGTPVDAARAMTELSDAHWAQFLEAGSTSLSRGLPPRELLELWRRRPVEGRLPPVPVLEALAEAGDWDDPLAEPEALAQAYLEEVAHRGSAQGLGEALHWVVTLALLRAPHRLPPALARVVAAAPASLSPTLLALVALLSPQGTAPEIPVVARSDCPEPRVLLAVARRRAGVEAGPLRVALQALAVTQRDWADRLASLLVRLGAELPAEAVQEAQLALDGLDGNRLGSLSRALRELRPLSFLLRLEASEPLLGTLLRGQFPELHRPARDALMQALSRGQATEVFSQLRVHFTICPVEMVPDRLAARLRRDPPGTWLQLVQYTDQSRVLGRLLDIALLAAPETERLVRVRATLRVWEAAFGTGDWSLPPVTGQQKKEEREGAMDGTDALRRLIDELAGLGAPEAPKAAAARERTERPSMLLEAPSPGGARSPTPVSDAAVDLIVAAEVSGRAVYEQRLTRPVWPKGNSGLTIGMGYDVGTVTAAMLEGDWSGELARTALNLLRPACLVRGPAAAALVQQAQAVSVPWDAAMRVFRQASLPEVVAALERALPNTAGLDPDCFGALVSLAYNRGAAFSRPEPRYAEMRRIRDHMAARAFERVPAELRAMKRLWEGDPDMRGVTLRREAEAMLFERGLARMRAPRPEAPGLPVPEAVRQEGVLSWLGGWMRPVIEEPTRDFLLLPIEEAEVPTEEILPDEHYVAVRVLSARIVNARRWTSDYHAAVHATCNMLYEGAGSERIERSAVLAPDGFRDLDPAGQGKLLQVDRPLFGPMPYRGDFRLAAALFSIKSSDLAGPYLTLVSELSQTASLGFLAAAQPFVAPLRLAVDALFGTTGSASLECGTVRGFSQLRSGTWACIGATREQLPDAAGIRLSRGDFRLLDRGSAPIESAPYLVFRIERLERRDDFLQVPELKAAWDTISAALKAGRADDASEGAKAFRRLCFAGGDLTSGDAARVAARADARVRQALEGTASY